MSTSPYYQTLNSSHQGSMVKNVNNEWISTEPGSEAQDSESEIHHRDQQMRNNSEMPNSRSHKSFNLSSPQQHLHMSAQQWNFPGALGNSYQRFYNESQYGIVLTPVSTQPSSLESTPSSSLHSINSDIQSQAHTTSHHAHHMQTSQHLKKIYYQGLTRFTCLIIKLIAKVMLERLKCYLISVKIYDIAILVANFIAMGILRTDCDRIEGKTSPMNFLEIYCEFEKVLKKKILKSDHLIVSPNYQIVNIGKT